ncbi:MAG: putative DNA-binding domain-containing protein [Proteobacteria bacterium]|nr:putative DNA-binding domain-containing protein [Pseudomonadota bacterium]MDE3207556.1 putative DNA-binding domain-containing protein [Pseudomonadota bacterium]
MPLSLADWQTTFMKELQGSPSAFFKKAVNPKTVQARTLIYRNTIFNNKLNALKISFPIVHALIGDACFQGLSHSYIENHPSTSGNLNFYGKNFPEFIKNNNIINQVIYLADMARLEWLIHELRFTAEDSPNNLSRLEFVPSHALESLRFHFQPSVKMLHSPFPVSTIWKMHQPNSDIKTVHLNEGEDWILLRQLQGKYLFLSLSPDAWVCTEALFRFETIGSAFSLAIEKNEQFDLSAHLTTLATLNLLTDYVFKEKP